MQTSLGFIASSFSKQKTSKESMSMLKKSITLIFLLINNLDKQLSTI